jgi:hypothetical protein
MRIRNPALRMTLHGSESVRTSRAPHLLLCSSSDLYRAVASVCLFVSGRHFEMPSVSVVFYSNFLALSGTLCEKKFLLTTRRGAGIRSFSRSGWARCLLSCLIRIRLQVLNCTLILRRDPGKCLTNLSLFTHILSRGKH